jgi:hypothetical protein
VGASIRESDYPERRPTFRCKLGSIKKRMEPSGVALRLIGAALIVILLNVALRVHDVWDRPTHCSSEIGNTWLRWRL